MIGADGIIATVAGTGSPGYSNDGQPGNTAQLNGPEGPKQHSRDQVVGCATQKLADSPIPKRIAKI
jgi:hypothetical protein